MSEPVDYPFAEVVAKADELIRGGAVVFQKYTCSGCGQRLTIDEPNRFYTTGSCDKCDVVTDVEAQGCNYMVAVGDREKIAAALSRMGEEA